MRALAKFAPAPADEDPDVQEERKRREREIEAGVLAALLWLKPKVALIGFLFTPWRREFDGRLSDALTPGLGLHDFAGRIEAGALGTMLDPLDTAATLSKSQYRDQFVREFGAGTESALRAVQDWAMRRGLSDDDLARVLTAVAGLNQRQAGAVLAQWEMRRQSGASPRMLDQALDQAAARALRQRTKTTAETEGWRLWQMGRWSAADQARRSGLALSKTWRTARDERVCGVCGPLDGATVEVGQPFPGGAMIPPLHPACRCDVGYSARPREAF